MSTVISRLEQYQSPTPSRWREEAQRRRDNKDWLRYSQHIALAMLDKMEAIHLTQSQLAERMNCSQQYVSKVLKGQENLSMETMFKIQKALDLVILPVIE